MTKVEDESIQKRISSIMDYQGHWYFGETKFIKGLLSKRKKLLGTDTKIESYSAEEYWEDNDQTCVSLLLGDDRLDKYKILLWIAENNKRDFSVDNIMFGLNDEIPKNNTFLVPHTPSWFESRNGFSLKRKHFLMLLSMSRVMDNLYLFGGHGNIHHYDRAFLDCVDELIVNFPNPDDTMSCIHIRHPMMHSLIRYIKGNYNKEKDRIDEWKKFVLRNVKIFRVDYPIWEVENWDKFKELNGEQITKSIEKLNLTDNK